MNPVTVFTSLCLFLLAHGAHISLRASANTDSQLSNILDGFEKGLSIDKVTNLFKAVELGSKFFKSLAESSPLVTNYFKVLSQRNAVIRVLTKHWLTGKVPDLKDMFDIATAKHENIGTDAMYVFNRTVFPEVAEFAKTMDPKSVTNDINLSQLFFGINRTLTPSEFTTGDMNALRNFAFCLKFIQPMNGESLFLPMFSDDYKSALSYLESVDYSMLEQIRPLSGTINDDKYSVQGRQQTDPEVSQLMQDIHGKYAQLLKGHRSNDKVEEEAVYDIVERLLALLTREKNAAKAAMDKFSQ